MIRDTHVDFWFDYAVGKGEHFGGYFLRRRVPIKLVLSTIKLHGVELMALEVVITKDDCIVIGFDGRWLYSHLHVAETEGAWNNRTISVRKALSDEILTYPSPKMLETAVIILVRCREPRDHFWETLAMGVRIN